MSVGRNDPCPCGSTKKYKHCCLNPRKGMSLTSKILVGLTGIVFFVCIALLISSIRNFEGGSSNRVWSEEHQHWHNL